MAADEECDLATLTALLDEDSDMEADAVQVEAQNNEHHIQDDDVDLETLTSFLEESDDDSDNDGNEENSMADQGLGMESETNQEEIPNANGNLNDEIVDEDNEIENSKASSSHTPDVNALQAQLLLMQEQMTKLQNQLSLQQNQSSPVSVSSTHQTSGKYKSMSSKAEHKSLKHHRHATANETNSSPSVESRKNMTPSKQKSPRAVARMTNSANKMGKSDAMILDRLLPLSDAEKQKIKRTDPSSHKTSSTKSLNSMESSTCLKKADGKIDLEYNPFFGRENKASASIGNIQQVKQDLKLDSDDSDFEGLDGEEKYKLSDEGREINRILTRDDNSSRVSHVTARDVADLRNKAAKSVWKEKGKPLSDSRAEAKSKDDDVPSVTDSFSGIRIVNPLVSSGDMKGRMQDRTMIKISRIASRVGTPDLQGNWVTIGVVVHKTEPRTSSSGKTFCIWKLSDLQDCEKTVSFFLFGEVYKQLWKNNIKTVIGILNPNIMDKAEKVQKEVAFTVNHPQQVLMMGYSKDLGRCSGISKAGKPCSNFINKQQGDRCTYHVQAAYSKTCSKRTELQGSYSGVTPKSQKQKMMTKKNDSGFFFYGGETFTSMRPQTNKNDKVTLKNLQQKQALDGKGRITTMSLHQLDAEDEKKLEELKAKKNEFVDMLFTPTVGSMNFVKHLVKKEKKEKENTGNSKTYVQSISAKDLLKQHQNDLKQIRKAPRLDPLAATPTLGKGFDPKGMVFLDSSSPKIRTGVDAEAAKRLAIAKVLSKGSIKKEDPNAIKKKMSPEAQQKVKKRLAENLEENSQSTALSEPPRKRSKLLGNVDTDSEEFKLLMKSRSKHKGALAQVEAECEERYFMELEKREKYEDKMMSIMETKCKAFTCHQCNYTAYKPSDRCKAENHSIKTIEAVKRFFKCKKCKNRCTTIQKYPTESCRNCGGDSFERTSMHQERKGPKLASEELCIRGDEIKYLGSLQEKVYLNS